MITRHWSFDELCFYDECGELDGRLGDLLRPHELRLPCSLKELEAAIRFLIARLDPDRAHLPAQALLAAALSAKDDLPDWLHPALPDLIDLEPLGLALDWRQLFETTWALTPIALAGASRARILWALVGTSRTAQLSAKWPRWWSSVADGQAQDAVRNALQLLSDSTSCHCYFWPLTNSIKRPIIKGGSLALPVYLVGWTAAQEGCPRADLQPTKRSMGAHQAESIANNAPRSMAVPAGAVLATGGLNSSGRIGAVGYLTEKIRLATESGFTALIYPAANSRLRLPETDIDLISVHDLAEACPLHQMYAETGCRKLAHYFYCVQNPRRLVANIHMLPEPIFTSKTWRAQYLSQLQLALGDSDLCEQLATNIERHIDEPGCSWRHMARLMEPVTKERVLALGQQAPLAAFRLAQVQLSVANHRGDIERSKAWSKLSETLAERVRASEKGVELYLEHLNRTMVHERHNRYDFRPELPKIAMDRLEHLEKWVDSLTQHGLSSGVNSALGRFYGTIAQNCGFCGPEHLAQLEHYVAAANRAFGGDNLPEFERDRRRQLNYLFYAHLEAGNRRKATDALCGYLGPSLNQIADEQINNLGDYQHAAIARFLAATGSSPGRYEIWTQRHLNDRPANHPWQLWLTNAGHFMELPEQKETAWRNALRLCQCGEPTIRIMALLPLSALHHAGFGSLSDWEEEVREILGWLPGSGLNVSHFEPLLQAASASHALSMVREQPHRFFPFTYR